MAAVPGRPDYRKVSERELAERPREMLRQSVAWIRGAVGVGRGRGENDGGQSVCRIRYVKIHSMLPSIALTRYF
jgi:hypothetical protein